MPLSSVFFSTCSLCLEPPLKFTGLHPPLEAFHSPTSSRWIELSPLVSYDLGMVLLWAPSPVSPIRLLSSLFPTGSELPEDRHCLLRHLVVSFCLRPYGLGSPPGSSVYEILQARILGWDAIALSKDLPDPGIKPMLPPLAGRFVTAEPQGKAAGAYDLFQVLTGNLLCSRRWIRRGI